jgi:hypothetical protein
MLFTELRYIFTTVIFSTASLICYLYLVVKLVRTQMANSCRRGTVPDSVSLCLPPGNTIAVV